MDTLHETHERLRRAAEESVTGLPEVFVLQHAYGINVGLGILIFVLSILVVVSCGFQFRKRKSQTKVIHFGVMPPEGTRGAARFNPFAQASLRGGEIDVEKLEEDYQRDGRTLPRSEPNKAKGQVRPKKCFESFIDDYLNKFKSEHSDLSPQRMDIIHHYVNQYKMYLEQNCNPEAPLDTALYVTKLVQTHHEREVLVGEFFDDYKLWWHANMEPENPGLYLPAQLEEKQEVTQHAKYTLEKKNAFRKDLKKPHGTESSTFRTTEAHQVAEEPQVYPSKEPQLEKTQEETQHPNYILEEKSVLNKETKKTQGIELSTCRTTEAPQVAEEPQVYPSKEPQRAELSTFGTTDAPQGAEESEVYPSTSTQDEEVERVCTDFRQRLINYLKPTDHHKVDDHVEQFRKYFVILMRAGRMSETQYTRAFTEWLKGKTHNPFNFINYLKTFKEYHVKKAHLTGSAPKETASL